MSLGKSIELFLVNGTSDSLVIAELSNWSGKAIRIPRTEVQSCKRDEIKGPGVYFLFCKNEDDVDSVYIGEAENLQARLVQHLRDYQTEKEKYYWTTAVMFTGLNLNNALISYLEYRLFDITIAAGRYKVLTKNTYKKTVLKESDENAMEEFILNIRILIEVLGYKVLEEISSSEENNKSILFCKNTSGADAKGYVSSNGFTVLKGSMISDHTADSFDEKRTAGYAKLRQELIMNGTIEDSTFLIDFEFSAPSAASAVILGRSSNGNIDWKTKDGVMLKDLEV